MNQKTAILVFANSAKEELLHKPIPGGEKLFNKLTKDTLKTVKSSKLPFFVFTEKNQQGDCFGQRFVHAMRSIYNLGFINVIAIGNDTPLLKKHHLLESKQLLENNNFVLGPSADGGFYLIGIPKSHFNSDIFLKLPWQSKSLTKSISVFTQSIKVKTAKLQVLLDIDTKEDLKTIQKLYTKLSDLLIKIINSILQSPVKTGNCIVLPIQRLLFLSFYNKGSPSFT